MPKKAMYIEEIKASMVDRPLCTEELGDFYFPTCNARDEKVPPIREIKELLSTKEPVKIFFAGQKGSGISTELTRICRDLKNEFHIIRFSVKEELEVTDLDYSDLVVLTINQLLEKCPELPELYIGIDQEILHEIYRFFTQTALITIEEKRKTTKENLGFGIPEIIKKISGLLIGLTQSTDSSSIERKEIREKIKPKISHLLNKCNLLFQEIENKLERKKLLFIIEDLDKVNIKNQKSIFKNGNEILTKLNAKIIFTPSIYLLNSIDGKKLLDNYHFVPLPAIKIKRRLGGENGEGIDCLKRIVLNRIDKKLFDKDTLDLAVKSTGGLIKDLFKSIHYASMVNTAKKNNKISLNDILYGLSRIKNIYHYSLTGDENVTAKALLDELYLMTSIHNKRAIYNEIQLFLLDIQALIEYNGEKWCDIHPLVRELLAEFKGVC